jgi:hypothetical protein
MTDKNRNPSSLAEDPDFFDLLTGSYQRFVGRPLVGDDRDAGWLYGEARFVVVAHDTARDPIFIYANKAAQRCFEYDWDEFTALPSRLSAELANRTERQALLDKVARNGFAAGYRGERITKSGRRFWIEDGLVWELIDEDGKRHGQAATFSLWR